MKYIKQSLNIKKKKVYKIYFFLFFPLFLYASFIYNPNVSNGEVVLVFSNQKPKYAFFDKKYYFYPTINNKKYKFYSLIPISYYKKAGNYPLKIVYKDKEEVKNIKVLKGNYKKEYLKVSKKHVSPPKKVINRIKKEYKEAIKIYNTYTHKKLWHHKFALPLNSKITSEFGNARIFNGKLKSYHSGIDFKAQIGTKIKAVNDGIVVLAKNRYFAGNSVVVSHGRGIYTCYYHLSKILVKPGDKIKKDEILGLSGKTGRVTGPHLHFSTWLNGIIVNPKILINLLNQI